MCISYEQATIVGRYLDMKVPYMPAAWSLCSSLTPRVSVRQTLRWLLDREDVELTYNGVGAAHALVAAVKAGHAEVWSRSHADDGADECNWCTAATHCCPDL